MSTSLTPALHAPWCPHNTITGFVKVKGLKGQHGVVPERGACLCRDGTLELSDPRPVVREAVQRSTSRAPNAHKNPHTET